MFDRGPTLLGHRGCRSCLLTPGLVFAQAAPVRQLNNGGPSKHSLPVLVLKASRCAVSRPAMLPFLRQAVHEHASPLVPSGRSQGGGVGSPFWWLHMCSQRTCRPWQQKPGNCCPTLAQVSEYYCNNRPLQPRATAVAHNFQSGAMAVAVVRGQVPSQPQLCAAKAMCGRGHLWSRAELVEGARGRGHL